MSRILLAFIAYLIVSCLSILFADSVEVLVVINIFIFVIFIMIVVAINRSKLKETGNEMSVSYQLVTPLNFLFVLLMPICTFSMIMIIDAGAINFIFFPLCPFPPAVPTNFISFLLCPFPLIVFILGMIVCILGILIATINGDTKHIYIYRVFCFIFFLFFLLFFYTFKFFIFEIFTDFYLMR